MINEGIKNGLYIVTEDRTVVDFKLLRGFYIVTSRCYQP